MPIAISARAQTIMLWWALAFITIYGAAYCFLIKMMPLPDANWTATQVADFYRENSFQIRIGAAICSWTGAFMVPLAVVITAQMQRIEKGYPIWSMLQLVSGAMMSIFLVLPPLFWGVAAFSPDRPEEVTMLIHEIANLTLTTTDQYFIFQYVAIAVVSLSYAQDRLSAFPRWFGYLTVAATVIFEFGVLAFLPKHGPFSWNGTFVYWGPLVAFGVWWAFAGFVIQRAIWRQRDEG